MYWLPRHEPERDQAAVLEMELFADVDLAPPFDWPPLDHLTATAFKSRRYQENGVVYKGVSYFGDLEAYLLTPTP